MSEPAAGEPPSRRGGIAPGWVFGALVLSFIAAFGAAALIYQRYVSFERRAALHLVGDAQFALRADLEKIVLYAPFRDEVLPLVQDGRTGVTHARADARLKPRLIRLSQHTGVELGVDVREIVFSRGVRPGSWVLAVGGMFPKGGVVQGIHQTLLEEGHQTRFDPSTGRLQLSTGVVVEQAADAVVLFGSDAEAVASALRPSERYQELGLGLAEPALSLAVVAGSGASAPGGLAPSGLGGARARLNASLDAAQPETLRLSVHDPAGAATAETAQQMAAVVATVTGLSRKSIHFKVDGPSRWVASVPITGEHVSRAAAHWATMLRKAAFPAP